METDYCDCSSGVFLPSPFLSRLQTVGHEHVEEVIHKKSHLLLWCFSQMVSSTTISEISVKYEEMSQF